MADIYVFDNITEQINYNMNKTAYNVKPTGPITENSWELVIL